MLLSTIPLFAQNSMVGDGFGGRLWYKPYNYTVGSYSAYTICGDSCGENNQLYGWGANIYGQLGNGTNISTITPVAVTGMTNVRYYSTGYCMGAIKNDNTAWVWGVNHSSYLYSGFTNTPQMVLIAVKFLDAGQGGCVFVKNDSTVWSVGSNYFGSFGNGTISHVASTVPIQMTGIHNAVRVANSSLANIILLADGSVMVAGSNSFYGSSTYGIGILGNNGTQSDKALVPIPIAGLKNIVDIKAIRFAAIALDSAGNVYTWGYNDYGFIGNGTTDHFSLTPIKLPTLKNIVAISGCNDGLHFLALDKDHNCYAWGGNVWGEMGIDNRSTPLSPILVATNVNDIMAGETFSYIVKSNGSLWASGSSNHDVPNGGSIWMNLPDVQRDTFTQIDPTAAPMMLCKPYIPFTSFAKTTDASCNTSGSITVTQVGGKPPYTYSIGGAYQNSNVFTNVSAGNYTVSVKDSNACISSVLTTVGSSTNSISNLSKTLNNATCNKNNGAINLDSVRGGVAPYQYNFNNSGFSAVTNFPNLAPGNYSIVVKDANGCNYSTTAVITNIGTPSSLTITDTICNGRTYVFNGNELSASGNYTATIPNTSGCDSVVNLQLSVVPAPVVHLGNDTTLCQGDTLRLNASVPNAIYIWQDGTTLPYYVVKQDGQYSVTVKTNCGNAGDTITVTYKDCEPINCTYFIPNAFTPNDDGMNDEFKIRSNCELSGVFVIYNRWGKEVFKTTDLNTGWDGKYKGQNLPLDVYAYYAEFTLNGKSEKVKGNVTLLR